MTKQSVRRAILRAEQMVSDAEAALVFAERAGTDTDEMHRKLDEARVKVANLRDAYYDAWGEL